MSGYHNVLLPMTFSQGSAFNVGFDTRRVVLNSGVEQRLSRGNPWGRRKYVLTKGIDSLEAIVGLRDFYVIREGSLNSFKMRDWTDYATTPTRTGVEVSGEVVTALDVQLVLIEGRTYQCVTRYSDGVRTIVRPITKIDDTTFLAAVDGVPTGSHTLDPESGIVVFGGASPITTATAGFEYYTVVRFADSTDEAFVINMQAVFSAASMPGIELIEEVDPLLISQDYQYGGANFTPNIVGSYYISEVNGRMQSFTPDVGGVFIRLPVLNTVALGGPIFVIHNLITSGFGIALADNAGIAITLINQGATVQVFVAKTASARNWLVI